MSERQPLTLEKQADLILYLIGRAQMRDGADAGKAWMLIEKQDLDDLRHIEQRLRRIAPFETQIRKLVTAR